MLLILYQFRHPVATERCLEIRQCGPAFGLDLPHLDSIAVLAGGLDALGETAALRLCLEIEYDGAQVAVPDQPVKLPYCLVSHLLAALVEDLLQLVALDVIVYHRPNNPELIGGSGQVNMNFMLNQFSAGSIQMTLIAIYPLEIESSYRIENRIQLAMETLRLSEDVPRPPRAGAPQSSGGGF